MEQAEIAEKSAKKFEPPVPKSKRGVNTKGCGATQPSQSKGKNHGLWAIRGSSTKIEEEWRQQLGVYYSFKDEQVHLFHKGNKLKLPKVQWASGDILLLTSQG